MMSIDKLIINITLYVDKNCGIRGRLETMMDPADFLLNSETKDLV